MRGGTGRGRSGGTHKLDGDGGRVEEVCAWDGLSMGSTVEESGYLQR